MRYLGLTAFLTSALLFCTITGSASEQPAPDPAEETDPSSTEAPDNTKKNLAALNVSDPELFLKQELYPGMPYKDIPKDFACPSCADHVKAAIELSKQYPDKVKYVTDEKGNIVSISTPFQSLLVSDKELALMNAPAPEKPGAENGKTEEPSVDPDKAAAYKNAQDLGEEMAAKVNPDEPFGPCQDGTQSCFEKPEKETDQGDIDDVTTNGKVDDTKLDEKIKEQEKRAAEQKQNDPSFMTQSAPSGTAPQGNSGQNGGPDYSQSGSQGNNEASPPVNGSAKSYSDDLTEAQQQDYRRGVAFMADQTEILTPDQESTLQFAKQKQQDRLRENAGWIGWLKSTKSKLESVLVGDDGPLTQGTAGKLGQAGQTTSDGNVKRQKEELTKCAGAMGDSYMALAKSGCGGRTLPQSDR